MKVKLFCYLCLLFILISAASANIKMENARKLFYQSVKDEDKLEKAIIEFEEIKKNNPQMNGVTTTYIGSLTMLKGKHAFWPHKKVEYVNEGIKVMDKGIAADPKNIESLFIYGSSCYYLPFFLGKKDLAIEKLRNIIPLLDEKSIIKYDSEILTNALKFILEKIELTPEEKSKVAEYIALLGNK